MTAYGPRAIVKSIKFSDITAKTTESQVFTVQVPAGFWIDRCVIMPVAQFTAGTSVASVNVTVGHAAGIAAADADAFFTVTDCKNLSVATAAVNTDADEKYMLNGQGVIDMDSEGTVTITVTPTYVGAFKTGEILVVLPGFQLPYPA